MSSLLAFALPTSVAPAARVAAPDAHGALAQPAKTWAGMSGSTCATVSATIAAIAGRVMTKTVRKRSTGLKAFDPTKQPGAMEPFGYWDPLCIMKEGFKNPDGAYKSEETFNWYRAAEIKHGRISMMAIIGLFFGECYKWPGFEGVPGGWAALNTSLGGAGFGVIFLVAGIFELDYWKQDPSKEPGNFGDPAGWTRMDNYIQYDLELRNKELAHCRLAMSGVITCFLLEYGGIDSSAQFTATAGPNLPMWFRFGVPLLVGLWYVGAIGDQFYVANDAAAPQPAYLGAGAPPRALKVPAAAAPAALPAAKKAAPAAPAKSGKKVLEKKDGQYRFKA